MKKNYILTSLVFLLVGVSFGQSIFENAITDPNPSAADPFVIGQVVDPNMTVSGIGRGTGILPSANIDRYDASGWDTVLFDNTAYFEFTLTPNAGYEIDFISFVYTGQASATGPTNILFRSSLDGYVADIGTPLINGTTIDLSTAVFQDLATPITFRIYAWGASSAAGTYSINDFTFNGSVVPNCTLTTTWDGFGWDNGFPDITMAAIIDGDYLTASSLPLSFEACSLLVTAGNELSINDDDYIQVVNDITIDGLIEIASKGSLIQVNDSGTITLNGTGTGRLFKSTTPIDNIYEYTYWSSPFSNETVGAALTGVPVNRIFRYDAANYEDTDADNFDDNSDDWILAGQAEVMMPGKGYAAFARPATMGYPESQQFVFTGEFNTGVITTPVTVSPDLVNPQNWNLLGNPYPSAIDADAFINDPANIGVLGGTIYLWTHITPPEDFNPGPDVLNFSEDDYASYTAGVGGVEAYPGETVPTGIIGSGQGFFIEGLANGFATFNNGMRVTTGNDNFYRATDRIWLNLENDLGGFSQMLIGFVEGATNGLDRSYDGKRLDGGGLISLSSLIDDQAFAIQGREPLTEEEIIPLAIKNLVEGDNTYKISIENVEGLLVNSDIYLIDHLEGVTHDLNTGAYRFSSAQGIHKERFELLLKNEIKSLQQLEEELLVIKNQDDSLSFTTTNNTAIQNVQIFDLLGRQLVNEDFNNEELPNSIKFYQLRETIFIVKATLSDGTLLTKKGLK